MPKKAARDVILTLEFGDLTYWFKKLLNPDKFELCFICDTIFDKDKACCDAAEEAKELGLDIQGCGEAFKYCIDGCVHTFFQDSMVALIHRMINHIPTTLAERKAINMSELC